MGPDGTIKLLGAILAGTPRLDGAACVGEYRLFDEPQPGVVDTRTAIRNGHASRGPLPAAPDVP